MDLGLRDRVCVVTGSTGGIGLATIRLLAAEGARAVSSGRSHAPNAGEALHVAADLSAPDAPAQLIDAATHAFGRVDVLVNNVGAAYITSFEDVSDGEWEEMWQLNVMSYVRAIRAVLPGMRERGEGGLADQMGGDREENLRKVGAGRPLGRLAEPWEIASVIVFLCSDRAAYVTGSAWSADGGTVPIII